MKRLYLVRHGQTIFNQQRRIQGWCDSPLTPLGQAQACHSALYFKTHDIHFDHAYCSTSERTSDTLELITDLSYTRLKGLKEFHFGLLEGESMRLIPPLPYGDFFKRYYQGEDEQDVRQRINTTLHQIMDQEDHHSVLLVSHGGAIRQFILHTQADDPNYKTMRLYNGCIATFDYVDHQFHFVDLYNPDLSHLLDD